LWPEVFASYLGKGFHQHLLTLKKQAYRRLSLTYNPPKRTAKILFLAAVFWAAMIFFPSIAGIDGFDGGYAISLFSLLLAITAGIAAAFSLHSARQLDQTLHGEGLLAHWTYTPNEWRTYSQNEYATENAQKKFLFLVVSAFALAFGVLFWALDPDAGFFVFVAMLGLIGLIGFVWRFTVWLNYRHNSAGTGEAYITRDAVYLNGRLYSLRAPLTRFEGATLENNRGVRVLAFQYSVFTGRAGTQTYTTRVPVPEGREAEAEEVLRQVNSKN
jgi:hypothetical protein